MSSSSFKISFLSGNSEIPNLLFKAFFNPAEVSSLPFNLAEILLNSSAIIGRESNLLKSIFAICSNNPFNLPNVSVILPIILVAFPYGFNLANSSLE